MAETQDTKAKLLLENRFRIESTLKESKFSATCLALDEKTDNEVVIKLVKRTPSSQSFEQRLVHEAAVLSHLSNDRLAAPIATGIDGGFLYIVFPKIAGETISQRLAKGFLTWSETLCVARDVLSALAAAHDGGILHRDVKPENVLVQGQAESMQAVLVDFGFAQSSELKLQTFPENAGTPHYLSPEGAGLIDGVIDARSDLYSLGATLFECLAGRPPFVGSVNEVLRQHVSSPVPDLRMWNPEVPKSLCDFILHLLAKNPSDRYQSAASALHDLRIISNYWKKNGKDPVFIPGLLDTRTTLSDPTFVGRDEELAKLSALVKQATLGHGGIVFVEAESGGGKTRLLQEFLRSVDRSKIFVSLGQGVDQMARVPFQLLTGLAQEIVAESKRNAEFKARILKETGEHKDALISVLPPLAELFGGTYSPDAAGLGPERLGELRNLAALSVLLNCIGTKEFPALLVLDDSQWADALTGKLFQHWQMHLKPRQKLPILIVMAYRSEEVSEHHPLRTLEGLATIPLKPLKDTVVHSLIQSMAGDIPYSVADLTVRLAGGSPFMASAVLRGFVESGALFSENGIWKLDPEAVSELQSSRHAALVLARRFKILPPQLLHLLKVGAVLGKEFDLELAASLAGATNNEAIELFADAKRRHIVWATSRSRLVFVHDKLRETLLGLLTPDERKLLHLSAAEKIEEDPERFFDLAYHFDSAGQPGRALKYALKAAVEARRRHSLDIAEQQYRIAERGAAAIKSKTSRMIAEGLGDVLMLLGNYPEALAQLLKAADLSETIQERVEINLKLGELYFKQGKIGEASKFLEAGLVQLGRSVPRSKLGIVLGLIKEGVEQALHTLFPRFFLARRKRDGHEEEFLAMRLHSRLAYAYWFERGSLACAWTHLRGFNLAERYPPSAELAQAYSEHAPVITTTGFFERGKKYALKSLEIRKSLGDVWGQGQSLGFYGIVLYADSDYLNAIESCSQAVRIMERTGDRWEINTASWHIAYCYYRLGRLKEAVVLARKVYQEAMEIGDFPSAGISLSVWAKAGGGKIPRENVMRGMESLGEGDVHSKVEVLQANGIQLLSEGKPEEAARLFEKASEAVQQTGMYTEYVAPVLPWWCTSLRFCYENMSPYSPAKREIYLKQAADVARRGVRVARKFKNNLPHALREYALVLALQNKPTECRRLLQASLAVAQKQGARYEQARSQLAIARFALEAGESGAQQAYASCVQTLRQLGANLALDREKYDMGEVVTLSLIDRFDKILEAGRKIASSLSRETAFAAIRDASLSLLRTENCALVELRSSTVPRQPKVVFGDAATVSLTLLEEAAKTRKPVSYFGDDAPEAADSLILSGVESALCIPVLVRGQMEIAIYLSHRGSPLLYGQAEERLSEFIATIAGAALENISGFESVQNHAHRLIQSNSELERYAYVASHDLQEPLRHIILHSELLEEYFAGQLPKATHESIHAVISAARRMKNMIVDLLQYSRVDSIDAGFGKIDSREILSSALVNLQSVVEESGARVEMGPLPEISGQRSQLERLFQNLVGNAIKFRSVEPVRISVQAEKKGDVWQFMVADNGIGFEEEYAESIFNVFSRLHSRDVYPGTGIGLATCKKIVERHGGKIWAKSQPGVGTTMYFTLPAFEKR